MALEIHWLNLGHKAFIFLPWPLLDLETHSWFTTNLVIEHIEHLKVIDTLYKLDVVIWGLIHGSWA